jgi:hypothetical protein
VDRLEPEELDRRLIEEVGGAVIKHPISQFHPPTIPILQPDISPLLTNQSVFQSHIPTLYVSLSF